MEITKMLTISTAHITKETALLLDICTDGVVREISNPVYSKGDYGWFIYIGCNDSDDPFIPNDLRKCLKLAENNDCDWLCLDRDAEIVDGLDKYEW